MAHGLMGAAHGGVNDIFHIPLAVLQNCDSQMNLCLVFYILNWLIHHNLTCAASLALTGILLLSTSLSIHQCQDRSRKRSFWTDVYLALRGVTGLILRD